MFIKERQFYFRQRWRVFPTQGQVPWPWISMETEKTTCWKSSSLLLIRQDLKRYMRIYTSFEILVRLNVKFLTSALNIPDNTVSKVYHIKHHSKHKYLWNLIILFTTVMHVVSFINTIKGMKMGVGYKKINE